MELFHKWKKGNYSNRQNHLSWPYHQHSKSRTKDIRARQRERCQYCWCSCFWRRCRCQIRKSGHNVRRRWINNWKTTPNHGMLQSKDLTQWRLWEGTAYQNGKSDCLSRQYGRYGWGSSLCQQNGAQHQPNDWHCVFRSCIFHSFDCHGPSDCQRKLRSRFLCGTLCEGHGNCFGISRQSKFEPSLFGLGEADVRGIESPRRISFGDPGVNHSFVANE